jgi:hypothetical protein
MTISNNIKVLTTQGIVNILSGHDHVSLDGEEPREELEQILQMSVNDDLIDEIEIILELSAE